MTSRNQYTKRVEQGQDLFDLCLQEYGSVLAIWVMLQDNPDLDLIRPLVAGTSLVFRVELPAEFGIDPTLTDRFRNRKTRVNFQEQELLSDVNYNTTIGGTTTSTQLPDLTPAGAGGGTNIVSGLFTGQGTQLRTSWDTVILPNGPDLLTTSNGQPLGTAQGSPFAVNPPAVIYAHTSDNRYLLTSDGAYLTF